jgi:hypothetical protein
LFHADGRTDGRTDRQTTDRLTDMTKLIVAFCSYAIAPKNNAFTEVSYAQK